MQPPIEVFTLDQLQEACEKWGCNCGPAALAVAAARNLDTARVALPSFESRHYTNPSMMLWALELLEAKFTYLGSDVNPVDWPANGLARIQWEGPWTRDGVPIKARYRHTHWVAVCTMPHAVEPANPTGRGVWDINVAKWISFTNWESVLVPEIIKECEPKATGKWWVTHAIEVQS